MVIEFILKIGILFNKHHNFSEYKFDTLNYHFKIIFT